MKSVIRSGQEIEWTHDDRTRKWKMEVVRKQLIPIVGNRGSRKTTKVNCGWWKWLEDSQSLLLKLKEVSPYLEELHRVKMESTLKEEDEITCA
ncbi:MAG: hypothetical protein P8Q39_01365 [Candidatus Thalassarchaeaceae archaeon]|nr:hypothetical protein [Candidatus Thalassarchaeaceae archaeon]